MPNINCKPQAGAGGALSGNEKPLLSANSRGGKKNHKSGLNSTRDRMFGQVRKSAIGLAINQKGGRSMSATTENPLQKLKRLQNGVHETEAKLLG